MHGSDVTLVFGAMKWRKSAGDTNGESGGKVQKHCSSSSGCRRGMLDDTYFVRPLVVENGEGFNCSG